MRNSEMMEELSEQVAFEEPTEEEIITLWQSLKSNKLSGDEAWHAIVTGIALDMAFARSKSLPQVEQ